MSANVFERLKSECTQADRPFLPGYEVRIDPAQGDEYVEIIDAHTIKSHRYIRLGSQFRWGDTLYVNPLDERLLP